MLLCSCSCLMRQWSLLTTDAARQLERENKDVFLRASGIEPHRHRPCFGLTAGVAAWHVQRRCRLVVFVSCSEDCLATSVSVENKWNHAGSHVRLLLIRLAYATFLWFQPQWFQCAYYKVHDRPSKTTGELERRKKNQKLRASSRD